MIFSPHFNKELVNKEKGIIIEEIKMYEDDPSTNLFRNLYENLFINDERRYLVSESKIIHTIDGIGNECKAIYCLSKANLFLIAHNTKILLYNIKNYNAINTTDYHNRIHGFIELNNENIISYNLDGNIIVWKITIDF